MITVYHNPDFNYAFFGGRKTKKIDLDSCTAVAYVKTKDLDEAYRLTNNIDSSWVDNINSDNKVSTTREVFDAGGCRSTSVGDVLVKKDKSVWVVANVGFISYEDYLKDYNKTNLDRIAEGLVKMSVSGIDSRLANVLLMLVEEIKEIKESYITTDFAFHNFERKSGYNEY